MDDPEGTRHNGEGETVLIQGATGVAGQLAIQVARHLGAKRIIASGRKVETLALRMWMLSSASRNLKTPSVRHSWPNVERN